MKRWLNGQTVGWTSAALLLAAAGVGVVLLAGGSGPAAPGIAPGKPPARAGDARRVLVKVIRPEVRHLKRQTTQAAHVEPYEKVDVFAKASGYLHKLGQVPGPDGKGRDLDIGDRVKKGDVLAELSIPEREKEKRQKEALVTQARAELKQAEAARDAAGELVAAARAKVEQARADLPRYRAEVDYRKGEHDRYQRMLRERTTSRELVDERLNQYRAAYSAWTAAQKALITAEAAVRVAEAGRVKAEADVAGARARVEVAEANHEQAKVLLDYATVRAPFDGVLTRRLVDTGAFVQSAETGRATPLFTLARVDRLRVVADIPENDSSWIEVGQPAVLRLDAVRGHTFTGKVARLADALDRATRTMRVEVELDGPPRRLRPGLYGTVTITLADYPKALTLPAGALLSAGERPTVMVVEDGVARRRAIALGINDGVLMQVNAGELKPDDLVITDGKNDVRDGQRVRLAQ